MCFSGTVERRSKSKCLTIAIISLIVHAILISFSIAVLILMRSSTTVEGTRMTHTLRHDLQKYFGNVRQTLDRLLVLFGVILFMGLLGLVATGVLIYGVRRNNAGCILTYLFYTVQASFLLLFGILFAFINYYWYTAIAMLIILAKCIYTASSIAETYQLMADDALVNDPSSDLQQLID